MATTIPHSRLATTAMSVELRTAEDLGSAFAPVIREFLADVHEQSG